MAYEFDLEMVADPPFTDALGTEIIEFALGYDLDRSVVIVMSVMLAPVDEAHDLRFGIREKSLTNDWKISAPDYSQEAVKAYIHNEFRGLVGQKVRNAIQDLIRHCEPTNITMETYYANLPEKALRKYQLISDAVHACKYKTNDQFRDGTTLKDHWLFTKEV